MRRILIPTLAFLASSLAFVLAQVQHQDDPIVLRLGSQVETFSEFEERFEIAIRSVVAARGMEMTDEVRAQLEALRPAFLEQRAQEVVLVAEARERGLTFDGDELDARIEAIRSDSGDADSFAALLVSSGIGDEATLRTLVQENELINLLFGAIEAEQEIGDDELRTAYEARRDQFAVGEQVCARHILLETVEDAEAALARLEQGEDFAELAAELSTGPSGPNGGDLGCFGRGQMVGPFEEAAFAAEVGVPAGPVETQFGQHLILVSERQEAGELPFEQVADQLRSTLEAEATDRVIGVLIDTGGVVTYPERLPAPPAPPAPSGEGEGDGAN
jgi:peptidyl-prolyl cis-trans isomerase C